MSESEYSGLYISKSVTFLTIHALSFDWKMVCVCLLPDNWPGAHSVTPFRHSVSPTSLLFRLLYPPHFHTLNSNSIYAFVEEIRKLGSNLVHFRGCLTESYSF